MQCSVITLFPELFHPFCQYGIVGRAARAGLFNLTTYNPRDYSRPPHFAVDDKPYGGGPGMVMQVAPLQLALQQARAAHNTPARVICLSPQGPSLTQAKLKALAHDASLIFIAGRYEGIDERLMQAECVEELSIGDYVLSGGELAAMVVIDGVCRLLPGALGNASSAALDSFEGGLLDHPHYTRPSDYMGYRVPEVLLSGDHEAIRLWRLKAQLGRTYLRRPDLLKGRCLSSEEQNLLQLFLNEQSEGA